MGSLSDADREAVIAKARADRQAQGLPSSVEDLDARKGIGGLLIRVKEAVTKSRGPG